MPFNDFLPDTPVLGPQKSSLDLLLPQTPGLGAPVPAVEHAISVQLPTWDDICEMFTGAPRVKDAQQTGYPRSFIHKDVERLNKIVLEKAGRPTDMVFLFLKAKFAKECVAFASSPDLHGDAAIPYESLIVRSFRLEVNTKSETGAESTETFTLYGVFCAPAQVQLLRIYLRTWGSGVSSRFAEDCWKNIKSIEEISSSVRGWDDPSYTTICERIADLLERSPIPSAGRKTATRDDVYLYPTGMSAMSHAQSLLCRWRGAAESVVFGFPYELTPKLLDFNGPGMTLFPFGTPAELDKLEDFLKKKVENRERVQAIWCECPSNPLLRTPDFQRLRQLADTYDVALVVDDTIGSFANIDMLNHVDVLVTSLTKSFSGYADVMGGSIVLNPSSRLYIELKCMLDSSYENNVYKRDTAKMEANSRNYLERTHQLNSTGSYLVRKLSEYQRRHRDILTAVYYPEVCWSTDNYRSQMRPATEEFTPGFGGLFTIEFCDLPTAITFFNNLHGVFKGPSLGANVTLVQPYVQTVFSKEKEFAARCGLQETIVRVSVGLENQEALLNSFLSALTIAADAKRDEMKGMNGYLMLN